MNAKNNVKRMQKEDKGTARRIDKKLLAGRRFPKHWKNGIIVALSKKWVTENLVNHRDISLLNAIYKIYARIVNERSKKMINEK